MIINFVLHKYNQTESALELQPTSPRLLERKAALQWICRKMEYSKKNKGNPVKIIRWQDGNLECFYGTMAEAENYAKNKSKVIKQTCIIA